ncbi:hypothetical protein ACNFIA_16900 [Pseudomonas sp. NY15437]|uniref:hypothetical protein n=1 Tax=Pseudomonas TaxID=286 RepID=UPI00351D71CF|nr:hypothetical protein [Pseudomonas aeruginosa]
MKRLPEGVRRVCIILGIVVAACWVLWVAIETDGFVRIKSGGWVIVAAIALVTYFVPSTLYRIYTWVRDGFAIDKATK